MLITVLTGTFMVVLDFFIVNVALPSMQRDLDAGAASIEWIVAGYGIALASSLITGGRLGDRFGRRRMYAGGMALFTIASFACGVAATPGELIAARVVQGLGAAVMSPNVLSIIGVAFQGAQRVRALSMYGLVLGLAAVGGQLLGGVLVELDVAGLGWRSVFLINVPIGIGAIAAARRFVPESRAEGGARLDLVGTGLVTTGLVLLVLPLVEGRQHSWPLWSWLSLGAAALVLAAFAEHQLSVRRRGGAPLIDLALFRDRAFSAGLATQLLFWSGQASFFLVLALYLQDGRGLGALGAGLVFTVLAAAYLLASMAAPGLTPRLGRRLPALGALALVTGHALMALVVADLGTGGSVAALFPAMALEGAGMGLVITPLTTMVLSALDSQSAGAASGALSSVQQVGNALGVAVTGVVFFGVLDHGYAYAFELATMQLAVLLAGCAAMTRLLPPLAAPEREAGGVGAGRTRAVEA
jgi:EmrB/QacA subfamily drug resistance transporter